MKPRASAAALASLFADSERPVYALDDQRRIVYCNPACAQWLGVEPEALLGQVCTYGSPADEPAAGPDLCPPPSALSAETSQHRVSCVGPDGSLRFRRGTFLALGQCVAGAAAMLVVLDVADAPHDQPPLSDDPSPAELHEAIRRFRHALADHYRLDRLVGASPAAVRMSSQVALAASTVASVLIVGPRGSGKEHLARAIHYARFSAGDAAIELLDCAVLDEELLGQVLRSLAGRNADQPATLLLRAVDRAAPEVQAELAQRWHGAPDAPASIATSERPLAALVAEGAFREDLACWLSTLVIELPPLVERLEDLPLLAQLFVEELNAQGGKQLEGFSPEALDALAGYTWPGNLDELRQFVEEAHEAAVGPLIGPRDLPKRIHLAAAAAARPSRRGEPIDLVATLQGVERELIDQALANAKGNKAKAARLLGLTRPRLLRRLRELGLDWTPSSDSPP
jgi:transcriptional regulator with PAS, ATPase and Fis domain